MEGWGFSENWLKPTVTRAYQPNTSRYSNSASRIKATLLNSATRWYNYFGGKAI